MVLTTTRYRTTTGIGTMIALILVLAFGSPVYVDWVSRTRADTAGGLFLRTLAWPAWSFNANMPVRDLLAADLKAILVVAFTAGFLTLMTGAELAAARGTIAALFTGWGAYVFAGALAGLLSAFIASNASLYTALLTAGAGGVYGLFTGWIVGLGQLGARRP
jgi:hypothetical protein